MRTVINARICKFLYKKIERKNLENEEDEKRGREKKKKKECNR